MGTNGRPEAQTPDDEPVRRGEPLEIVAPKLGYRIRLDALQLESITWQAPETFSRFLETPFGPGA